MNCPICQSKSLENLFFKKLSVYKCLNCGTEFIWPQPSLNELNGIYQKEYYKSWGFESDNNVVASLKKTSAFKYLEIIKKYKENGKFLDIGCAFGFFLEIADKNGYDTYGVELSPYSSKIAKDKFGTKIFNGQLEEAKFPNQYFDIISMIDLLEHISEPLNFMKEVKRILKSDGIIVIITPNTSSFSRKLLGSKNWFHYKLEHLFYFNKKSLSFLMEKLNFEVIDSRRAVKAMNLDYLQHQFCVFKNLFFTPLINLFCKILPLSLRRLNFYISGGEMLIIFVKKNET